MIIDKGSIKILLIILILGLGIGYAYINSDLNINGTAQVNSANWDVHWANIQVKTGSVSGSNVLTEPTIQNQTTVRYSVILDKPGDYYVFTLDAVNGGSIDAMIDTIDSKLNGATITTLPNYLSYLVTYSNGELIEPNHELKANTTEKYRVEIKYRDDIELNQIPATNQTLNLQFTVTYRQANENAQAIRDYVYTANIFNIQDEDNTNIVLGSAIPNAITQYSTGAQALAALRSATNDNSISFYLKHKIKNGVVADSYIEFIITPSMANANPGVTAGTYSIIGGLELYDLNKEIMDSAFGSNYCTMYTYGDYKQYSCNISSLNVSVNGDYVGANSDSWVCGGSQFTSYRCETVYIPEPV